ncbi:MAG: heavy metal-associated domain-containing protein [Pseudomonadota bacterium]|nr:heavy metal-associated domain-containing protein [Pseudomonadota bacterium]
MTRLVALLIGLLTVIPPTWADEPQIVEIEVTGMTCPFCVYGTEKKLNRLPGVEQAQVSLKNKKARIVMKPGESADLAAIRRAIVDSGFSPGKAAVQPPKAEK